MIDIITLKDWVYHFFPRDLEEAVWKLVQRQVMNQRPCNIENSECAQVVKYTENFICKMIFASISIKRHT